MGGMWRRRGPHWERANVILAQISVHGLIAT